MKDKNKSIFIITLSIAILLLGIYFNYKHSLHYLYVHLFYILIILTGIWFSRYVIAITVYIVIVHIVLDYIFSGYIPTHAISESIAQFLISIVFYIMQKKRNNLYERYHQLVSQMQLGLATHEIITDENELAVNYRFIYVNKSFEMLTGLKSKDVLGKTVLEVLPNTELYWIKQYGKVVKEKKTLEYQNYSRELGKWYEVIAYSNGKNQFTTIVSDITERKEMEKKLEEQRKELKLKNQEISLLINSIEDIVFELDINKKFKSIYGKRLEKAGFKLETFIGKGTFDIFEKEVALHHEDKFESAFRGETTIYEWDIELKNNIYYFQSSLSPIKNEKGEIIGIAGVARDITNLKILQNKFKKEKERMKVTLLSIVDGIVTTDTNGVITSLNKAAEIVTGWKAEEVKGRNFSEIFILFNEITNKITENPVEKVLRTGKTITLSNHTNLKRKDGKMIPIKDSVAPIKDEYNNIHGVVMVFRDVTREKKSKERIIYLSYKDSLTKLYNRRFIERETKKLDKSFHVPVAVIIGDVNGLKLTNDIFGHKVGDELLKKIAETIKENCKKNEIAGRWGGDEFLIIIPNANSKIAESIIRKIQDGCLLKSDDGIQPSISFGYSIKTDANKSLNAILKEAEEMMYNNKLLEGRSYRNTVIKTLMATLFEKSIETEEHAERLKKYSYEIGKRLDLPSKEIDKLMLLSMLHDIGKVGISENILEKPETLNKEEYDEMKKHPEIGYRIAQNTPELLSIAEYILFHHERWDGKGYPSGIKGEEIPLLSRILAVVDAYDAMISDRIYRKAMSKKEALEELEKNAGAQFDPHIVDIFLKFILEEDI